MQSVDIIIPVYNEEDTIENVIDVVDNVDFCGLKKNIIIVDDCSTDSTRSILKKYEGKFKVIYKDKNGGKGSAVSIGFKNAMSDIVVIQDADLEYDPNDYIKLINLIIRDDADIVYGSRFLGAPFKNFMFLSYVANRFLTALTNLLYGTKLTDMETCYKAFKRECIKDFEIKAKKFEFEPEITAKIVKNKLRLKEVPVSYNARKYKEGKKVGAKDALQAIFTLFYYRFFD